MRISVDIVPRARGTRVERLGADHLRVAVAAPPHEGQANEALVTVLAEYFDVSRSRVRILRGHASRRKVVEIVPP
jgi:uncharacterized protein (TIGR00251 family)